MSIEPIEAAERMRSLTLGDRNHLIRINEGKVLDLRPTLIANAAKRNHPRVVRTDDDCA